VSSDAESAGLLGHPASAVPRTGRLTAVQRDQAFVVAACLFGNIVSPTPIVYGALSVFLVPIAKDFAWPREQVSGVFILLSLLTALAYPVVGRIADRFGPRRPILFGNLAFGACVIALGFSTRDVVSFYLVFALIGAFGSLPSTMMYNRVVSGWFDKTRGAMLGITSGLGNGAGATIMPPLALLLMSAFGWRGGFIGLGAIVILAGFPALLLGLKQTPLASGQPVAPAADLQGMSLAQAARTLSFWLLLTAICLGAGCLTAVMAHIVPILSDRRFPVGQAALVVSVFATVTAIWQIVMGWLLDRTGSPKLVAPLYIVSVIGLVMLERGSTFPVLMASGALMGIGMGTEYGVLPYLISRYFGLRRFGAIAGVMYSAIIVAQGITPYLMDVDFDHRQSYVLSLHIIDVLLVIGAAIIALLPTYAAAKARWSAVQTAG
jgi:MFS family permease